MNTQATGGEWQLVVPDPGGWLLSANHHTHWRTRALKTKAWRTQAAWLAAVSMRRGRGPCWAPGTRVHITATIHHHDSRRRDVTNSLPSVKAAVDGILDILAPAGFLPDDSDRWIIGPDMRPGDPVPRTEARRIVLTLTPITPEVPGA